MSWLKRRETELAEPGALEWLQAPGTGKTLSDAIDKYTVETNKEIGRTKAQVLNCIKAYAIADLDCAAVTSQRIVALAQQLLDGGHQPSTGSTADAISAAFTRACALLASSPPGRGSSRSVPDARARQHA